MRLVTGSGPIISSYLSGIGLESSILFAREGAHVLLVDINLEAAEKGAALITQRYPNVKALATKADVGKEADIKAAVDKAVKEFGRLDVMVGKKNSSRNFQLLIAFRSLIMPVC